MNNYTGTNSEYFAKKIIVKRKMHRILDWYLSMHVWFEHYTGNIQGDTKNVHH